MTRTWWAAVAQSVGALADWIDVASGWTGSTVIAGLSGSAHRVRCRAEGQRLVAEIATNESLTVDEVDALVSCGWLMAETGETWYRSWLSGETSPGQIAEDIAGVLGALCLAGEARLKVDMTGPETHT